MPEPWEQQPDETTRAFECFMAFRDAGRSRQLVEVYRRFTGRSEARCPAGTWNNWVSSNDWWNRAAAYDAYRDRALQEEQLRSDKKEHRRKLEQFRKAHENSGMGGLEIVLNAKRLLADFVKSNPAVKDLDDATKLARIIQTVESPSSQAWADALGIKTLLQELDARN